MENMSTVSYGGRSSRNMLKLLHQRMEFPHFFSLSYEKTKSKIYKNFESQTVGALE
jgi:hypothetical protein